MLKIKNIKIDEKINLLNQMINDLQNQKTSIGNQNVSSAND